MAWYCKCTHSNSNLSLCEQGFYTQKEEPLLIQSSKQTAAILSEKNTISYNNTINQVGKNQLKFQKGTKKIVGEVSA